MGALLDGELLASSRHIDWAVLMGSRAGARGSACHYPSHLWIFPLVGRLDVFFWIYVLIHLAYLGRGWLGIIVRFGRP